MPSVELAVIAAAGLGSRLGAEVPKCLVPIDGVSIIERQLELLRGVPEIRVVVGYREVEVIDLVSALRPDAIFVRNPQFASTNTIHSLRLATRHRAGWFLAVDGDLIIEPASFARFLRTCDDNDVVLGVGPSGTDEGVFVQTCGDLDQEMLVTGFSREVKTALEWSGLAHLHSDHVAIGDRFVFEALTPHLPMVGEVIDAAEVDTARDLRRAREIVRAWEKSAIGPQSTATSSGASEARG